MQDRLRFRAWNKEYESYAYNIQDFGSFYPNPCWQDSFGDFLEDDDWIIEQCTGLKDKNGELIYENDVVEIMVWDDIEEDMVETKGKVYWSKEDASFLIYVSFDGEYPLYGQEIKVIGNIHTENINDM